MQRLPGRVAVASLLALYACSSDLVGVGAPKTPDGGTAADPTVADGGDDGIGMQLDGSTPPPVDAADAALPPGIRYLGRSDTTDPAKPTFSWPGARIIARFSGGTAVKVTLDETTSLPSGPSRWDVLLDGTRTSTLAPAAGMGTYTIASGLDGAEHTVELYRRTEAMVGKTQLIGLELVGGTLLSPPPAPNRRIEFLGDSISAGYGNECAAATETFSGATENERLAFTGLVAHDLGADHHNAAYSGRGVYLNYTRADLIVFADLYPRIIPNEPASAGNLWAFTGFTPDVVWINLGGNDWDQDRSTNPYASAPNLAAFTQKYIDLVTLVRSKYGSAHIFMSLTPSLNDGYPFDLPNASWNALTNMRTALTNIVSNRDAAGDKKVYKYEFARAIYPDEVTGCGYHANLALHRKMADQVIVQIKAKTLWQ